jgi:hypothetical protein
MNFGTPAFTDPFVGSGNKVRELVKSGATRQHWDVHVLRIGLAKDCKEAMDRLTFNWSDPLLLNEKNGAPAGVPKTPEHRLAIAKATAVAMEGNNNALGRVNVVADEGDAVVSTTHKLKWFNNGLKSVMVKCDLNNVPVNEQYKSWTLGQLRKNSPKNAPKSAKPTVSTANLAN